MHSDDARHSAVSLSDSDGILAVTAATAQNVYMSTDVLSVRIPTDLKRRLDALSASTGRPQAFYVREAVTEHIDALEWAYGVAAEAEAVRNGQIKTRPLEELATELGFDPAELSDQA